MYKLIVTFPRLHNRCPVAATKGLVLIEWSIFSPRLYVNLSLMIKLLAPESTKHCKFLFLHLLRYIGAISQHPRLNKYLPCADFGQSALGVFNRFGPAYNIFCSARRGRSASTAGYSLDSKAHLSGGLVHICRILTPR